MITFCVREKCVIFPRFNLVFVWFSFMSDVFINFCLCVVACEFYHMAVPLVLTIWFFFHSFFCMTMFRDERMRGCACILIALKAFFLTA